MVFTTVDALMVRTATQPLQRPSGGPPVPEATPTGVAELVEWLRAVWRGPLADAIDLANPELAQRIHTVLSGRTVVPRDAWRLVRSVQRYEIRARGRATPLGLFAGVAPAQRGARTSVTAHPRRKRACARVDSTWLAEVTRGLERDPEIRPLLSVMANSTAFTRDDRLVLPFPGPRSTGSGEDTEEVSVRLSTPVTLVMQAAAHPVRLGEMSDLLVGACPHVARAVIDALLDDLIAQGFLLTNLRAPSTAVDPLAHLLDALAEAPAHGVIEQLLALADLLAQHDSSPAQQQQACRARVRAAMRALSEGERVLSVDLHSDVELTVSEQVLREAEQAASALLRLNPHPFGPRAWQDFHARFLERYGIGALIPVHELLLADTGLGFPAGFRGSRLPELRPTGLSDRDTHLLRLAHRAAWEHHRELVLDEDLIAQLSTGTPEAMGTHTELTVQLGAESTTGIDRGEFLLHLLGVTRAAGTVTGRFLELLDPAERERMAAAYRALPTLHEDAFTAQLSCPAQRARADNVARYHPVTAHTLRLGEHAPPGTKDLSLQDLAVTADARQLLLVSLTHGRPVHPQMFSALEYQHAAHPLARFLAEISTARAAACTPFSWGSAAGALPYLPRVRYGRTILTAARWRVYSDDLPDASTGFTEWRTAFARWRNNATTPATVTLGAGDQRLRLDLDHDHDLRLLRETLHHDGHAELREAPTDRQLRWCHGRAHELVIPLATTQPARAPMRRWSATPTTPGDTYPPGSACCYLKLYVHPDRQNSVLRTHLPRLLGTGADAPAWWFLRYEDPEPHLRVRVRTTTKTTFSTVANRLATWSADLYERGLLSRTQLDTYTPETGRFGAAQAMRAAEDVFIADTQVALAQLDTTEHRCTRTLRETRQHRYAQGHAHPDAVIAVSLMDLAAAFCGTDAAALRWLIEHVPRAAGTPLDRRADADTRRLLHARSSGTGLPDGLVNAWAQRHDALANYRAALPSEAGPRSDDVLTDLLHLHCVRMTGLDLARERACVLLARSAALGALARTASTR